MEAGTASAIVLGLSVMLGGVGRAQEPGLARSGYESRLFGDESRVGDDDAAERSSVRWPALPILFSGPAAS